MMWLGRRIVIPIILTSGVKARLVKRGNILPVVLFPDGAMNGQIGGNGCILDPYLLVAVTDLYVGVVLDARKGGIEDIVVEDILRVFGLLLCAQQRSHKQKDSY